MKKYKIMGRSRAGSLVIEFLFHEANVDYDISFLDKDEQKSPEFLNNNPLGRIPVLICPDGKVIFESLAIIGHLVEKFDGLAPKVGDELRDKYNQYMALMATSIYPAYHRQYHTYQYGPSSSFDYIRECAREVNDLLFDHLEFVLNPFICGKDISAADFYLYMLCLWEGDKDALVLNRPNLNNFLDKLKFRESVIKVLSSQPKNKKISNNKSWVLKDKKFVQVTYKL